MTLAFLRLRLPLCVSDHAAACLIAAAFVATPLAAQTPPTGAPVTAPAGAAAPGAAATGTVAAGSATPTAGAVTIAPRQSWMSDRRSFAVGDIITVMIDDYTITTAVKENTASETRGRNLGVTARLPSGGSKGAGIDSRNDASQQQRGTAKRENRFQNEMSVRVVAVGEGGLLQVKGTKNINVDKSQQDIVLTGWVRSQDINPQNMVESFRLADATIGYASPGSLAKPKQGFLTKILGALWP